MRGLLLSAVGEFASARPLADVIVVGTGPVWEKTSLPDALSGLGASPESFRDAAGGRWQSQTRSLWLAVDSDCVIGRSPVGGVAQLLGACELTCATSWRDASLQRSSPPVFDLSVTECIHRMSRIDTSAAVADAIRRLRAGRGGHVVVVGYGGRGKAVVSELLRAGIPIAICDVDPLAMLEAQEAGHRVGRLPQLFVGAAGVVVAARGRGVVAPRELAQLPAEALVIDLVGHLATSLQIGEAESIGREIVRPSVTFDDEHRRHDVLAVLTLLCLLELRLGTRLQGEPVPAPRFIEEWAARIVVGAEIQGLSAFQALHRGCGEDGPFGFGSYWGR